MATEKPSSGLIMITMVIYGLHFFSALGGVLSPAFIITAFVTGWPSVIAVLLSYLNCDNAEGTYLESHYTWVIRTFWLALIWLIVSGIFIITFFGLPVGVFILLFTGAWVMYRIIRGVLALLSEKPVPIS
jgi:uncharacterized membrane protein